MKFAIHAALATILLAIAGCTADDYDGCRGTGCLVDNPDRRGRAIVMIKRSTTDRNTTAKAIRTSIPKATIRDAVASVARSTIPTTTAHRATAHWMTMIPSEKPFKEDKRQCLQSTACPVDMPALS